MSDEYYNEKYFGWQAGIGCFGGWANLSKFSEFIHPSFNVLDFGCGGGQLLANIDCAGKIGIEINPHARANANKLGIETRASIEEVPDGWADLVISNNALEHCQSPFEILCGLLHKSKDESKTVFYVPCEAVGTQYRANDINKHLYTWSPMNLGNLFCDVGYEVISVRSYFHKWPPHRELIAKYGKRRVFELCCRIYGFVRRDLVQVRIVASKQQT